MRRAIDGLLTEKRHDLVHALTVRVAGLLEGANSVPRVIDFVDAISLNLRRRAEYDRTPLKFAARIEANLLARYEREICRTWDHATVVSPVDRAAIGDFPNLSVNSSGIDLDQFAYLRGNREPRTILFSGNLGYFPNVDAISWFARHVFPAILREEPNARLQIVGARPGRRVRTLAKMDPRITVIGQVDSLCPYLQRCHLAIAPMRAGSGQLFKILEAMASGAPIVATSLAAAATGAESGRHLLIADGSDSFARSVLRLIREPDLAKRIAVEARQMVEQRFRWEDSISGLEQIYQSVLAQDAAAL
jgi:glycosyltransferase involved in cell wall biosynthesis